MTLGGTVRPRDRRARTSQVPFGLQVTHPGATQNASLGRYYRRTVNKKFLHSTWSGCEMPPVVGRLLPR